jgi:hypothetical protein
VLKQLTGMMPKEWVVRCEGICSMVTEMIMMVDRWKMGGLEVRIPLLQSLCLEEVDTG